MNVTIRSGEVSSALLYTDVYLKLTGITATITSTGSTERVTKPILKQLSDFLQKGDAMEKFELPYDVRELIVQFLGDSDYCSIIDTN